jgi:hypothetical protein
MPKRKIPTMARNEYDTRDNCNECDALTDDECTQCGLPLCDDCVQYDDNDGARLCWRCDDDRDKDEND